MQSVHFGDENQNIEIGCLAFPNNVTIIGNRRHEPSQNPNWRTNRNNMKSKQNIKEKTEFIATKWIPENKVKTRYETVFTKWKFEYLGEWTQPNDKKTVSSLQKTNNLIISAVKLFEKHIQQKVDISRSENQILWPRPKVVYEALF